MSSSISSIPKTKIQGLKEWQLSETKIQKTNWQAAYEKSNLNWNIEKRPLFDKKGKQLPIFGTFRSDNNNFLGAVSERYHIIQNKTLYDIANDIQQSGTALQVIDSGTLNHGQGVYLRLKTPFTFDIGGYGDIYMTSLLMRAFHDGGGPLQFAVDTLRLICTNGMKANRSYHLFNVIHSSGSDKRIQNAKYIVNQLKDDLTVFKNLMIVLEGIHLNTKQVGEIVSNTFSKDGKISSVSAGRASVILQKFELNDNNEFTKQQNTAYALFQSYTNFADHNLSFRKKEQETEAESRNRSILFGAAESLKFIALNEIVKLIKRDFAISIPDNSLIK